MKKVYAIITIGLIVAGAAILFLDFRMPRHTHYSVGIVMAGEHRAEKLDGLKAGLHDLGYGDDVLTYHVFEANDEEDSLHISSRQLIKEEVDVAVTLGAVEALVLKRELEQAQITLPVVFAGVAAPEQLGLIEDYRAPSSFLTGVDNTNLDLAAKRLELFVDLLPELERVIVLYNGHIDVSQMSLEMVQQTAPRYDVSVVAIDLDDDEAMEQLEQEIEPEDGILIMPSYQIESMTQDIADFSVQHGIPTMGIHDRDVEQGFLFSYGTPFYEQGYQAARHVSSILQGTDPEQIPVELPDTVRFMVNAEVRQQLNIEVNPDVIRMAEVVESINGK